MSRCISRASASLFFLLLAGLGGNLGCTTGGRVDMVADVAGQPSRTFFENFTQAEYGQLLDGPYNNLLIVMRSRQPRKEDPVQITDQLLVMRIFWRPQPGRTAADPSLTDARLLWFIRTPEREIAYEGTGFVSLYCEVKNGLPSGRLTGEIESAHLKMLRGDKTQDIFGAVQVRGRFAAEKNPDAARRLANEVEQILGPYPPRPSR